MLQRKLKVPTLVFTACTSVLELQKKMLHNATFYTVHLMHKL
jgi:hypothetical protein